MKNKQIPISEPIDGADKMKQNLALVFTSAAIISASLMASAKAQQQEEYKIYIYKDCEAVQEIVMNAEQVEAYNAFKNHEKLMAKLELPLEEMEQQLELHEQELDSLSDNFVIETEDSLVVNKTLVEQHEAIAKKMEKVVASHRKDIEKLELHARAFEGLANDFEKSLEPSLGNYRKQDIQIQIGQHKQNRVCKA